MRTLSNEMAGGNTIRMGDPSAGSVKWQLRYSNITDAEWATIEQLFETAEGRLTTFTFLDPTANLLMWSEDWTKPVWTADPMLQVATGVQDPFGASNAVQLTNTAQSAQGVVQTIAGASWFQYCFSVYLRSDAPSVVQIVGSTNGQVSLTAISTGPAWVRAVKSGTLSVIQDGVGFGVQLAAGARIQAFGAQLEAQTAPGQYKKTIDRGGVYTKTRFDSDALTLSTNARNQNSGTVNLYSRLI